jgi:hypothetical protein
MKAEYNPHTLEIFKGITPYQDFHEHAHLAQHYRQTIAWRARNGLFDVPFFNRLSNLFVEVEASLIARRSMIECGIWRASDWQEAIEGLISYALSLTILCEESACKSRKTTKRGRY